MGKSFLDYRRTYLHSILLTTPRCQLVTLRGLLISTSSLLLILIFNLIQDPSCAWDIRNNQCAPHSGSPADASALLQNLAEGFHAGCGGATAHPGKTFLVEKTSARLSTTLPLLLCHPFCFQFPSPCQPFQSQVCPRACRTTSTWR